MTACNGATETDPNPGMMQSIEEHQIPKEDAAVMSVGDPRKRRRVWNLAAERIQKRKERTRGYRGSRRKSAAACKVSRRAKVAWRRRNLFRRTGTQENCGSRKRVTVTNRRLTRYTGEVRLKEKVRMHYEGNKRIKDLGGRLPLCPRNKKTSSWTYRKTIDSVKITKQKAGSYAASRKIKDWTLWRGRPLQNEKKKDTLHTAEAGNVETPAPNR
jgi:hypothetical protein